MLDIRGEIVQFLILLKEKRDQYINKYIESSED